MCNLNLCQKVTAFWFLKRSEENVCDKKASETSNNEEIKSILTKHGLRNMFFSRVSGLLVYTSFFESRCLDKLAIMIFRSVLKCITKTVVSGYGVCFLLHRLLSFLICAYQVMLSCQSRPARTVTSRDRTTN